MLLIPAIDLRNGRCVRLLQGDFAAETRYEYEPHELLQRYRGIGATWLHVVDLDGARDGTLANRSIVVSLASQNAVRIQVGGGVRSAAVVDDLLRHRVSRVVIGSLAVERPSEVIGWLTEAGMFRAVQPRQWGGQGDLEIQPRVHRQAFVDQEPHQQHGRGAHEAPYQPGILPIQAIALIERGG